MTPQIILVKVTQKDIRMGKPKRVTLCPVARALRRRTKICWAVATCTAYAKSLGYYFYFDAATVRFITRFDSQRPVKPFTAVLRREK